MTAVPVCSDFGAQENKICHCFHFFPRHLPWSDGTRCQDLTFLNAEFSKFAGILSTVLLQHHLLGLIRLDQIRSVAQSCPTFCDLMHRSTPGLPVHYQLPEFTETHVHRVTSLHGKFMGKQWETLFSWAPKSLQMVTVAMKFKDACSLEEQLWPT